MLNSELVRAIQQQNLAAQILAAAIDAGRACIARHPAAPAWADEVAALVLELGARCGQQVHLTEVADGWKVELTPLVWEHS